MWRGLHHEWDMAFASSGAEALDRLAAAPFDMVVADMRMPGMDGSELLHEVMVRHPATVRIILSGQCDRQSVLKSVGPTHQFLTKPCDPATLESTIAKIGTLRDQLPNQWMKQVVSRVQSIPSWRPAYEEFLAALKSPAVSMNELGRIVSRDVGLAAKILQLVNSGFFGTPQGVVDVTYAVNLLGLDAIRELAYSTEAFSPFNSGDSYERPLRILEIHSLAVAMAASEIARTETHDNVIVSNAHTAGLLHDVGVFVLAGDRPGRYLDAVAEAQRERTSLTAAENSIFQTTRDDVGAYLMGLWGMPDPIVKAIAFHLRPSCCSDCAFGPLAAVHVANAIIEQESIDMPGLISPIDTEYLERIGCADRLDAWTDICRAARQDAISLHAGTIA